jgi:hypothetical protein
LSAPSQPALYYLFAKRVAGDDASPALARRIRTFLDRFNESRRAALDSADGQQDATMIEFTHLMQHGTNVQRSLERRLAILVAGWESRQPDGSGNKRLQEMRGSGGD